MIGHLQFERQCLQLKEENEQLSLALKYIPGGDEYSIAKQDFESPSGEILVFPPITPHFHKPLGGKTSLSPHNPPYFQ